MSRQKPSLLSRFIFLINNIVAILTWTAYIAWYVNPSTVPYSGMLALTVPAFILVNVLFVIFWLFMYKRYALLSLITIALGYWHIAGLVGFSASSAQINSETSFRVMSFNTKYYYAGFTWAKTYAPKEEVQAFVEEVDPDIFCMQEFQDAREWVPRHKLKYKFLSKHETTHLAIFSAYPIINSGEFEYPKKTQQYDKFIFADVLKELDTIRIVVAHLASFGLESEDLSNMKNFDKLAEDQIKKSGKTIFKQLRIAYEKHGVQVNALKDFIANSPYPVILCGDLNDTPNSYAYRQLTKGLNDSFREAGSGFGTSQVRFAKNKLPLRIDHILIDPLFQAVNWQVIEQEFSDHYPIYADLEIRQ